MENRICLDTDVLIDFLRNEQTAVAWIKQHEQTATLATTTINLFELYYGAYKSKNQKQNLKGVHQLKGRLILLSLSEEGAEQAGKTLAQLEKTGNLIDFRDILIGTLAQTEGFAIKTNNIKHFAQIPELKLSP